MYNEPNIDILAQTYSSIVSTVFAILLKN